MDTHGKPAEHLLSVGMLHKNIYMNSYAAWKNGALRAKSTISINSYIHYCPFFFKEYLCPVCRHRTESNAAMSCRWEYIILFVLLALVH